MKMRNSVIVVIAMVACVCWFTACDEFFTPHSPSSVDSEAVFTNLQSTEATIAALYEQFGADKSYRNRLACGYQGLNTDIEKCTKDADYAQYNTSTANSDLTHADGKDPWGYLNTIIERASLIIEGIESYANLEQPEFRYYLGEALFLRSFAYLEMVKLWGDVPPRFESLVKNSDGMNIMKDDRNKIFDHLRIDLAQAAEWLPWSAECPGKMANTTERPSKAAALALLARVDLMYAGYAMRPDYIQQGGGVPCKVQLNVKDAAFRSALYQEALEACAQIISNSAEDSKLLPDFEQIFKNICTDVIDYSKSEVIWEIPFADGQRGQVLQYNSSSLKYAEKALKNNGTTTSNSIQYVSPVLFYAFEPNDKRRDVTVFPFQWNFDDASSVVSEDSEREFAMPGIDAKSNRLYQKYQTSDGWYLGKYRCEWMVRERKSGEDGVNFPIIRYADVLLMFAEAAIGGITGDVPQNNTGIDPQVQFNRIRQRAGVADKELSIEAIIDERAFEFCGEYIRKYDLMRWGILKQKLVATMAQINDLRLHQGIYANLSDTIYFKYKTGAEVNDEFLYVGGKATAAYVPDSIFGLNPGEKGKPATYKKENGWLKKAISDSEKLASTKYVLYKDEELIEKRELWPIFLFNIGSSNGTLWNDYDYE